MSKINDVLTSKEACDLWKLHYTTVTKLIKSGKLIENVDYRKSGGTWLITREAMENIYGKIN